MKGKDDSSSVVLPSCSKCGATLDLELIESFGSRRIVSSDDAMMENHIIVIIPCVLPMRSNKSTDCYPFHGGRTTTTTTTSSTIKTIDSSRVADKKRERPTVTKLRRFPQSLQNVNLFLSLVISYLQVPCKTFPCFFNF